MCLRLEAPKSQLAEGLRLWKWWKKFPWSWFVNWSMTCPNIWPWFVNWSMIGICCAACKQKAVILSNERWNVRWLGQIFAVLRASKSQSFWVTSVEMSFFNFPENFLSISFVFAKINVWSMGRTYYYTSTHEIRKLCEIFLKFNGRFSKIVWNFLKI